MGKGKKKGDKSKKEDKKGEPLTIHETTESQAGPSHASSPPQGGLSEGVRKKRRDDSKTEGLSLISQVGAIKLETISPKMTEQGKEKDDKSKKDEPLTIHETTEPQAGPSHASSPPQGGLSEGVRKKRRDDSKTEDLSLISQVGAIKLETISTKVTEQGDSSTISQSEQLASTTLSQVEKSKDGNESDDGLGIPRSRKKRNKKKKTPKESQDTSTSTDASVLSPISVASSSDVSPPVATVLSTASTPTTPFTASSTTGISTAVTLPQYHQRGAPAVQSPPYHAWGRGAGRGQPTPKSSLFSPPSKIPAIPHPVTDQPLLPKFSQQAWSGSQQYMSPSPPIGVCHPQAHITPTKPQSDVHTTLSPIEQRLTYASPEASATGGVILRPQQQSWRSGSVGPSDQSQMQVTPTRPQSSVQSTVGSPGHSYAGLSSPVHLRPSGQAHSGPSRQSQSPVTPAKSQAVASVFKIPKKIMGNLKWPEINVICNYLPMKVKLEQAYRYDVTVTPQKPKHIIVSAYKEAIKKLFGDNIMIAYDQMKNCYTKTPLPNVDKTGQTRLETEVIIADKSRKTMTLNVSFKATGVINMKTLQEYMLGGTSLSPPTEAIQCIDVILRQGTLETYVKAGRRFFIRPHNPVSLTGGLEMWTGLFQSAIFASRPFINIDVVHKGFPIPQPLMVILDKEFGLNPAEPLKGITNFRDIPKKEAFLSFIKGLKVVASVGGSSTMKRTFICTGIGNSPKEQTFTKDENPESQPITVYDYFLKDKKYRIKYDRQNLVQVGPKEKKIFYPMELLTVAENQVLNKQLNDKQLSNMVKVAATKPDIRLTKITDVKQKMNYSNNEFFRHFGLEIEDNFFVTNAKVIQPPILVAQGGQRITVRGGKWQANQLNTAQQLGPWAVVYFGTRETSERLIQNIRNSASDMGMRPENPLMVQCLNSQSELETFISNFKQKVKFFFVVIGDKHRDQYNRIKKYAEVTSGVLTQCMKEATLNRINPSTARNILLKINSKLHGKNFVFHPTTKPRCLINRNNVMIVGADVTHPSPDQTTIPSIAAVIGSIDPDFVQYHCTMSVQTPRKEMIVDFNSMIAEHMTKYRERNGRLPEQIFVFRDGVSEGQFEAVMKSELMAIHDAYKTLAGPNKRPQVLFVLVQKRHNTRLFMCGNGRAPSDQNVPPGTCVDKDIVHPHEVDFYLVSHEAIKGTARPTRYHAICNDLGITLEEVEELAHYLCHLYVRCTRAVSYPTPTYYAHLACLRAKALTHDTKFDNDTLEAQPVRIRLNQDFIKKYPMYFV